MTGPEHYAEAEQLLELASQPRGVDVPPWVAENIAAAQVHATLALASALEQIAATTRPRYTHSGDQFVYDAIGKAELDRLRSLLSHSNRDHLTTWEVVEIAADELARAKAVPS